MAKTCPVCGRQLDSNDSCSYCGYKEYKEKLKEEARNDVLYDSTKPEFRGSKYEKEFEDSKDSASSYTYGESAPRSDFFEKTEKKAVKRGVTGIAIGVIALALIIVVV
ncbi:MAG: hypothetical protein MJ171_08400, partial [Clostridia bacterium]|nr:hypothetical protein [Clostridia bacterium]